MQKGPIVIACSGSATLGLPLLHPLQGELKKLTKERYEKLKHEILTDGFSFPIAVWHSDTDGNVYILDGHQRYATLNKMQDEGYSIPELPVVTVEAKSLHQAKRKLLAAASQYGKITTDGLTAFLTDASLTAEDLISSFEFAEIDLQAFSESYFADKDKLFTDDDADLGAEHGSAEPPWDEDEPKGDEKAPALSSEDQVRMVQLFLNGRTQPEFLQKCSYLQDKLNATNLTETVYAVVLQAYNRFAQEAADEDDSAD